MVLESNGDPIKYAGKLSSTSLHDKNLIDLISLYDHPIEDKLKAININFETILKNTERLTGFSYT